MTFDWYPVHREHKKVVLCSAEKYKELKDSHLAIALMGSGLCEWEYYLGGLFTKAVSEAVTAGKETADITAMFSCDLCGVDEVGTYCKKQENVVKFLMEKLFDIVEETEEQLTVAVKAGVLD